MKYLKIADQLRRQVRSGVLKPGEQLPSLGEMRQQGVSQNTMERVHLLLEQEGLIVRQHRRGVFVAERHRERATGIIGVLGEALTYSPDVPYWSHLLSGLRTAANENGREVLLLGDTAPGLGWEKIDGVLICGESEITPRRLPPGMPAISLIYPSRLLPSVVSDDYAGAKELARHLLQQGHRRIACLTTGSGPGDTLSKRRWEGYRVALGEAGIEPDRRWIRGLMRQSEWNSNSTVPFYELGYDKMKRWLQEDWHRLGCTALMTQNDETAIGAIAALRESDLSTPEDVSVVGFDGTKVGEYCTPRLTSVHVTLQEIGEIGIKLLLRRIAEEELDADATVLPTQLVVRDSSGPVK